jgi:hypothetical protein
MKIWNLPLIFIQPLQEKTEPREAALVFTHPADQVVQGRLNLRIASTLEVKEASLAPWEVLAKAAWDGVYPVHLGGGASHIRGRVGMRRSHRAGRPSRAKTTARLL